MNESLLIGGMVHTLKKQMSMMNYEFLERMKTLSDKMRDDGNFSEKTSS